MQSQKKSRVYNLDPFLLDIKKNILKILIFITLTTFKKMEKKFLMKKIIVKLASIMKIIYP